ncbi:MULTISPECIES: RNA polymerase sigma factor [Streptomyces]|uniref:Sigma-70 family RNA polymerase sigma factor n=1 Tax=Streptomyces silvisoli TaxID=3034235 RepID=A0ABT5ZK37_9ACTN|nr:MULTISPECIES: sigma-70 family RNA polymerase sigma factor [Streptomyces]MDF3290189.1 sigma-70 family RNA polymerase sigma factor [Streptomyces silvisoli]
MNTNPPHPSAPDGPSGPPLRQPVRRLALTFEAFHDTHHLLWLRYAHLHTGSRAAALRIEGAISRQLATSWPHVLRQESVPFYAWTVLKEHVANWLSAHDRPVALTETAAFDAVSRALREAQEQFAVLESRIGLYSAIAELPERQCDVIVLRFALGYDDPFIAALLGVEESTVRSHVSIARRKLAARLGIPWRE